MRDEKSGVRLWGLDFGVKPYQDFKMLRMILAFWHQL